MRLIEISRIKDFTTHLFAGDRFDGYLLAEAQFSTDATYTIDGHVNPEFVGEEQMMLPDYREGLVVWKRFRPICYEIIKGRKVPQQFRIIMKLPEALMDTLLSSRDLTGLTEKVSGLFLNI